MQGVLVAAIVLLAAIAKRKGSSAASSAASSEASSAASSEASSVTSSLVQRNSDCPPWIPQRPPLPTFSGKTILVPSGLDTIAKVINANSTLNGDTLLLDGSSGIYQLTQPISVYKKIRITSANTSQPATVTAIGVQAAFYIDTDDCLIDNLNINQFQFFTRSPAIMFRTSQGAVSFVDSCRLTAALSSVTLLDSFFGSACITNCTFDTNLLVSAFFFYGVAFLGGVGTQFVENCQIVGRTTDTNQTRSVLCFLNNSTQFDFHLVARNNSRSTTTALPVRTILQIDNLGTNTTPSRQFYVDSNNFDAVQTAPVLLQDPQNGRNITFLSVTNNTFSSIGITIGVLFQPMIYFTRPTLSALNLASNPPVLYLSNNTYTTGSLSIVTPAQPAGTSTPVALFGYNSTNIPAPSSLINVLVPPQCGTKNFARVNWFSTKANVSLDESYHTENAPTVPQ